MSRLVLIAVVAVVWTTDLLVVLEGSGTLEPQCQESQSLLQMATTDVRTDTLFDLSASERLDTLFSRHPHLFLGQLSIAAPALTPELLSWSWERVAPLAAATVVASAEWPKLEINGSWDMGLKDPRVYVISLEPFKKRRLFFADAFNRQGFNFRSARWMPAVDGSKVPKHLSNPHGSAASGAELGFSKDKVGVLGCFLSHILVIRDHVRSCPDCDLLVFEDDIGFHPNFRQLWTEFIDGVPHSVPNSADGNNRKSVAKLHFGGDAFWTPPLAKAKAYYQVSQASRTWGYVMKARAIEGMLAYLQQRDSVTNNAIDAAMVDYKFVQNFPVLAPKQPLVRGCGIASTTGVVSFANADQGVKKISDEVWKKSCWIATYTAIQKCEENVTSEERRPKMWPGGQVY